MRQKSSSYELIHMYLSSPGEGKGNTETDQPITHPRKRLTQLCWTADYTSGDQNLEKMMLDNEIAPTDHYWESNKFGVSCLMT